MVLTPTRRWLLAFGLFFATASCNGLFDIEEGLAWPTDGGHSDSTQGDGGNRLDASYDATRGASDGVTGDRDDAKSGDSTGGRSDSPTADGRGDAASVDINGMGPDSVNSDGKGIGPDSAAGDASGGREDVSVDQRDAGGEFDAATRDTGPTNCVTEADCVGPHVRTGAPVSCMAGRCIVPDTSCLTGWGHCTNNDLEFCETDLTSPSHCGMCTQVCPTTLPLCKAGSCVSRCMSPTPTECGGSCVDTATDPQHCGMCNSVCEFPNAEATCAAGKCTMGVCKPGYGDCTSGAGCETRVNTLTHCAQCNKPCGATGDIASCDTGTCVISCVRKPEECFNNQDDDCDGATDCADSDCAAVAVCEPVSGFTFGTTVEQTINCPAAFSGGGPVLQSGLDPGSGCTGCGCTPGVTECTPISLHLYPTQSDCLAGTNSNQGIEITQLTTTCAGVGFQFPWTGYQIGGSFNQTCATTGAPKLSTPTWANSTKFCAAPSSSSSGCSAGNVCVPKPTGLACLLAAGSVSCPTGFTSQQLYTSYSDTRVCSCACTASGGNCDDVVIRVSTGMSGNCDDFTGAHLGSGACGQTEYTQFGYKFEGAPGNPTSCTTTNEQQGMLTPTGPQTLCCR